MDLTLVDSFVPIDFGHPQLGAGLIDQELLKLNEERESMLHNILTNYPAWRVRYELDARKLKEKYFSKETRAKMNNQPIPTVETNISTEDGIVTITCSQEDMRRILHTKLEELNGDNFLEAYEKCLQNVKELCLEDNELGAIILTGGASRMSFIRAMAEEVFPGVNVIQGNEPELSIAQGLTYALYIDDRIKNFNDAINELTKPGGKIETLIMGNKTMNGEDDEDDSEANLGDLFDKIAGPVVDEMIESVIMPEFRRWKKHEIASLNDMTESIKTNGKIHFNNAGRKVIAPKVKEWLMSLAQEIERLTNPICLQYGIPQDNLMFEIRHIGIDGGDGMTMINPSDFLLVQILRHVIDAIVAIVITSIFMTLGATGPIGIAIGIILFFIANDYYKRAIEDFMKSADLPGAVRFFVSENRVHTNLKAKRTEMLSNLIGKMKEDLRQPTEEMKALSDGILIDLKTMLQERVDKVAMLLN